MQIGGVIVVHSKYMAWTARIPSKKQIAPLGHVESNDLSLIREVADGGGDAYSPRDGREGMGVLQLTFAAGRPLAN